MMFTLFIDTHFKDVIISLYKNQNLLDFIIEKNVNTTSQVTMPIIEKILERNNCNEKDLNRIVVCIGPGSFTGVRVGVTIAKLLSYLLNIPIYTITSLELAALYDNYNHEEYGIIENNGIFKAKFKNKKIIGSIQYEKTQNIPENIFINSNIDLSKLLVNFSILKKSSSFLVNPLYIKELNINKK